MPVKHGDIGFAVGYGTADFMAGQQVVIIVIRTQPAGVPAPAGEIARPVKFFISLIAGGISQHDIDGSIFHLDHFYRPIVIGNLVIISESMDSDTAAE